MSVLVEARQKLKLSRAQMAEKMSVTTVTIFNYEKKRVSPNMITMCRIADAYKLSIDKVIKYYMKG